MAIGLVVIIIVEDERGGVLEATQRDASARVRVAPRTGRREAASWRRTSGRALM